MFPRIRSVSTVTSVCLVGGLIIASLGASSAVDQSLPQTGTRADRSGDSLVATIDQHIRQGWADRQLTPSKRATDGEWCRRVYLDILGRIPSVEELERYLRNKSRDKNVSLVNTLLGPDYADEYSRHWTTIWTNLLIGRTGGTENRNLVSRSGMQQYLRQAFDRNLPYDTLVRELITATGSTVPDTAGFNGATNFLADKLQENGLQATAKTSQIFLGLQVQCTQCHNHPFNDWKQNQFWELSAFFRQSRPLRRYDGRDLASVELVDETFTGEGNNPAEAELYYELRNGLVKVAYPVFVDGTSLTQVLGEKIGNSGYLEDVNRRQELAKLVVQSTYFEQAIVNRYWAHFLGYGFTKPLDDAGPHNPPTHPELLATLGQALRANYFDLKQLIRWITLSEAYALSSRTLADNQKDDPSLGEKPAFSHFYLRQMQAEQLYQSLLVATEAHKTAQSKEQSRSLETWLAQFTSTFGNDEGDEQTTFNGTLPQALMMMNGELINRATGNQKGSFLDRVASDPKLNSSKKIYRLYLAALARTPTKPELAMANRLLVARNHNVVEALQDVWWVLMNSNEFILNH